MAEIGDVRRFAHMGSLTAFAGVGFPCKPIWYLRSNQHSFLRAWLSNFTKNNYWYTSMGDFYGPIGSLGIVEAGAYILAKLQKRICQTDLLMLDELSYISFNRHQSELLYKAVSDRSDRGSVNVTTNLTFSQWTDLFENRTMVAAMVNG